MYEGAAVDGLTPAAGQILSAYQSYWREALLNPGDEGQAQAQKSLLRNLRRLPALSGQDSEDIDMLTGRIPDLLANEGLYAISGMTAPLYELMIWRKQEVARYEVALPESTVQVKVVFLDDFVSPGWAGFATCGVAQTGGGATPDGLYAVRSGYDLASEDFRVSYLAHEGQHFADYQQYPALEQPELEYRAKLTEIILSSETTSSLLRNFASSGGPSRDVPHAFANRHVTLALKGVPPDKVREVAGRELHATSVLLNRLPPVEQKRFLPD